MLVSRKRVATTNTGRATRLMPRLGVAALLLAEVALVKVLPTQPAIAIAAGVLALTITFALAAPTALQVAAFPATFLLGRIAFGSFDMSVCDGFTALALVAAVPFVPWHNRALRRVLVALAFYLGLLAVSVLATPSTRAAAEWGHRAVLFGGTVVIGAVIADRHHVTAALRALIAAASVVAVAAIIDSLSSGLEPAYAFGLNKNAAGPMLAICAMLLFLIPEEFALPRSVAGPLLLLTLGGLLATQSRGAGLALVITLAINSVRRSQGRRRRFSALVLVATLAVLAVSVVTLRDEDSGPNAKFNGVNTRTDLYDFAMDEVWAAHPLTGGGLKWFEDGDATAAGPHNIAVAELSEAGIVGMAGLVVLVGGTLTVLWTRRSRLGQAGAMVFVFAVLFAMTGVFWVAGPFTLPMLVVGLAIGHDQAHASTPTPTPTGQRAIAQA